MRFPVQRIFHFDQITQIVGKGGDVVQRIFDRERLARGIDGDGGDLVQRIGDGRQITRAVVPKCGRVIERIGDGGDLVVGRFIRERRRDSIPRRGELRHREGSGSGVIA